MEYFGNGKWLRRVKYAYLEVINWMPVLMYGTEETWTFIKADMRPLKSIEGKTKRSRIRNEQFVENLKLNTLEDKLPNNRMR